MKFFKMIKKNFKLLLRSKSSAFIVFIGPLLIILLVGLVFSGKASYDFSIGYFVPDSSELSKSFISSLEKNEYLVTSFPSEQLCIDRIKQGAIHTCIIFPPGFRTGEGSTSELRFVVDYSRINLVYKLIQSISGVLEFKTKEISYSLTQALLSKINTTKSALEQESSLLRSMESSVDSAIASLEQAKQSSSEMDFGVGKVNLGALRNSVIAINQSFTLLKAKTLELANHDAELIEELSPYLNSSEEEEVEEELTSLSSQIGSLENSTSEKISSLYTSVQSASSALLEVERGLNKSRVLNENVNSKMSAAILELQKMKKILADFSNLVNAMRKNLQDVSASDADTIVSPVDTKIEPISSDSSNISFTSPFLLVLIIMFVSLLLSSTLVIFEKNSNAFFRNSMTPARPLSFISASLATVLLIVFVQSAIILFIASKFLGLAFLPNILSIFTIIFVASFFFIMIGMIIGYSLSTQEGAVMSSVVIGSLFFFVSNLVVPLESITPYFASIIRFNPYILFSELFRKSLLFKLTIGDEMMVIGALFGLALLIFLAILLSQSMKSRKRIKPPRDQKPIEESIFVEGKPKFVIGSKSASDREELLKVVYEMTKSDFDECVNNAENRIADFVSHGLHDSGLAKKIRKAGLKKEILILLAEDVKKHRPKQEQEPEK